MATERPKKLQRISQACDLCHRRSIRCRPSTENPQQQCQNCYDFAVECTYKRPSRRRRNPSAAQSLPPNALPSQGSSTQVVSPTSSDGSGKSGKSGKGPDPTNDGNSDPTTGHMSAQEDSADNEIPVSWRAFAMASAPTINQYMEFYMNSIYPTYPLFHGPTLWERLKKRHHLMDRGFFASVMAACALAAARVRDGALGERQDGTESPEKSSEVFYAAAQEAIPKELSRTTDMHTMRACALLALTSIQYGHVSMMHQHLGTYMTLCSMQGFHDEKHWPENISVVEKEERRRLFWSMYTLDVYTAIIFDSMIRIQETIANVRYPSEVKDEDLTAGVASPRNDENWLRGWNFNTDLYRILEHAVKRMRRNREVREDRICVTSLMIADGIPERQVLDNVERLYQQLPRRFTNYAVRGTGDRKEDFFGFQAANIQATLALVRMTLNSTNTVRDVYQKCNLVEQVLYTFHSIAPEFLRAISTPLIYHLAGIGRILISVTQGLLCEDSYRRIRALLMSLASLLESLEIAIHPADGASKDIKHQVDKIDKYMDTQRQLIASVSHPQQRQGALPHVDATSHPGMPSSQATAGIPILNGMGNGAVNGMDPGVGNGMGIQTLDEFQLPADLVNDLAWPWPFHYPQENDMPMMGYQ